MLPLIMKCVSAVILGYCALALYFYLKRDDNDGPPDLSDRNPGGM